MYVDAAGYHRSTTVAVAKGTKKMKKISKAVASEKDPEAQKYLLAQRQDTAMNLQHSMQVCGVVGIGLCLSVRGI